MDAQTHGPHLEASSVPDTPQPLLSLQPPWEGWPQRQSEQNPTSRSSDQLPIIGRTCPTCSLGPVPSYTEDCHPATCEVPAGLGAGGHAGGQGQRGRGSGLSGAQRVQNAGVGMETHPEAEEGGVGIVPGFLCRPCPPPAAVGVRSRRPGSAAARSTPRCPSGPRRRSRRSCHLAGGHSPKVTGRRGLGGGSEPGHNPRDRPGSQKGVQRSPESRDPEGSWKGAGAVPSQGGRVWGTEAPASRRPGPRGPGCRSRGGGRGS